MEWDPGVQMAFWRSGEAVEDFGDYDPTPYSGGYDLHLTYGRPLPPLDETCYPLSAAGDVDSNRPHFSSGSRNSSACGSDASLYWNCGGGYGILPPNFAKHIRTLYPPPAPQTNYPDFAFAGDGAAGEHGAGYGERPNPQAYGTECETGYGWSGYRRSEEEAYGYGRNEEYGSGGKASYERPSYCGREEGGRYGRSKHGNYSDDEVKKHRH